MSTPHKHITFRDEPAAIVIDLIDPRIIECTHIHELNMEMQQVVRASLGRNFIIDFQQVDSFSSSLLSVLITLLSGIQNGGGNLCISGLSNPLRSIFKLMNLEKVLAVHETTEKAMLSLFRILSENTPPLSTLGNSEPNAFLT